MEALKDSYVRLFNSEVPRSWEFDRAGFLKCRTTVMRSGVLTYPANRLNDKKMPPELKGKDTYRLYVPADELARSQSIDSLDGRPINVDHNWETILGVSNIGNVAGKAFFNADTGMVHANILVTNPVVIKRIVADEDDQMRLVEQSAGYTSDIEWTPGVTNLGEPYDGVQRNITYNHIALVGEGQGRAGSAVRILNKRSCNEMAEQNEYTRVKFWEEKVHVLNADVEKMEKMVDKKDAEMSNLVDSAELNSALEKVAALEEQIASLESEKQGYVSQLQELKDKVEEVTNPEVIENQIEQTIKDREDAQKVYNSLDVQKDRKDYVDAVSAVKSLRGDELYKHVVNSHRILNSKEPLEESPDVMRGRFLGLVDSAGSARHQKKSIAGADVMQQLFNSTNDDMREGKFSTPSARLARIYEERRGASK